ncbi:TPA: hypothetical protein ACX3DU_004692 [Vibrio parahaemolyticus]
MPHIKLNDVLANVTKTLAGKYDVEVELVPISQPRFFEIIRNDASLWLNWKQYMPQFWEKNESVHFVVKPIHEDTMLSGVVGYYVPEKKQLYIGLLEHFIKGTDNPIKGTLIQLMATTALYFLVTVDGESCIISEPYKDVVKDYEKFGFKVVKFSISNPDEVEEMEASTGDIMNALKKLAEKASVK